MTDQETNSDKIETFHGALVQHGPVNNRIYLIKFNHANPERLIPELAKLAARNRYTKIFAVVPASQSNAFFNAGYQKEAEIPGYFNGKGDALFLGCFLDPRREIETSLQEIEKVIGLAGKVQKREKTETLERQAVMRQCKPEDSERMRAVYKQVFESYPFPLFETEFIRYTMEMGFIYFCIEVKGKMAALATAAIYAEPQAVEMTDFATLPDFRRKGYASMLLKNMEARARERGIKTSYTIARAISPGMNLTFAKSGYVYAGRLKNNTNISGHIESMNIWYKKL
jgi:putative beta-lysine N-acetyltransferase